LAVTASFSCGGGDYVGEALREINPPAVEEIDRVSLGGGIDAVLFEIDAGGALTQYYYYRLVVGPDVKESSAFDGFWTYNSAGIRPCHVELTDEGALRIVIPEGTYRPLQTSIRDSRWARTVLNEDAACLE
jgi:hypothetical protein